MEVTVLEISDYIGFFARGISYGVVYAGIFFLVGLTISQCVKLIQQS